MSMDETNGMTDNIIAAAFAASSLPESAIDVFLNRFELCIEKLKERKAAKNKPDPTPPHAPRKKRNRQRGSPMAA